ncbi:MAG: calcium/sodium antiporter [Rikenellaceae bacterium]|nr:calcium/sodium antiporter [Rikenellaceae bacterium]
MDYILLIIGLALITFCADLLTRGCVGMAARFRVPEFIIGLTVMAVGTSMPELTVSMMSALKGSSSMAIGNVTGSNIFNTLVILGICAMIKPVIISKENVRRDIPICIGVSLLLWIATADRLFGISDVDTINRVEGIILLMLYVATIIYSIRSSKGAEDKGTSEPQMGWVKIFGFIIIGLAGLIFGGNLCLDSATAIARAWGVSESIIAITIVAAGTSLPELASSLSAIISKKPSLALGNILGSNIANILLILGASASIKPLTMGDITQLDLGMVVGSAILLMLSALVMGKRRITRFEGVLFFAAYVAYVVVLMK